MGGKQGNNPKHKLIAKKAAFNELLKKQMEHSKVRQKNYTDLALQPYLQSKIFQHKTVKMLTLLRSVCVKGIKQNFSNQLKFYNKCPLQCVILCENRKS